jgi:putative nucleotidyltransferase with HDIG domain
LASVIPITTRYSASSWELPEKLLLHDPVTAAMTDSEENYKIANGSAPQSSTLDPCAAGVIPPAIKLIPKLLALSKDPDIDHDQIVSVVRVDPGLSTAVIRIANSAIFGGLYHIDTVLSAINRLGTNEIVRIALQVVASESFNNAIQADFPDLWEHSLYTAIAAQVLAARTKVDAELAFTAGLLHDIGKLALWHQFQTDYLQLLADARLTMRPVFELEHERLSIDHAAVAGRLLSEWNFAEGIVNAVAFHHEPIRQSGRLAIVIWSANNLAHAHELSTESTHLESQVVTALQITRPELADCTVEIQQRLARELALFR